MIETLCVVPSRAESAVGSRTVGYDVFVSVAPVIDPSVGPAPVGLVFQVTKDWLQSPPTIRTVFAFPDPAVGSVDVRTVSTAEVSVVPVGASGRVNLR